MSQADIDEWLGAQAGGVDENVLEAMRGIADQGAMRVPAARAAAVPPAPDRNADQGETGLRWTASSSASGIEAWGGWSQTERDITLELPVADETRGKQVRWICCRRRARTRTLTRTRTQPQTLTRTKTTTLARRARDSPSSKVSRPARPTRRWHGATRARLRARGWLRSRPSRRHRARPASRARKAPRKAPRRAPRVPTAPRRRSRHDSRRRGGRARHACCAPRLRTPRGRLSP